ncbi:MAG: recombination mediator RecR [Bacteroidota bacterium]|nr:recombination mediator RecR [Bacteroidota bacterium]
MKYSSTILADAVEALSLLPGVGKKSALRMAIHLAQIDQEKSIQLAQSIMNMAQNLKTCNQCNTFSDEEVCEICNSKSRDHKTLCIIESVKDLMAIEETLQYNGTYHVLGALISPIDGIGPEQLKLDQLQQRIQNNQVREIIMAIKPSIDGDTTIYYLSKNIIDPTIKISLIARGVSFGSELEYADELTLGRSIISRTPYSIHDNISA